MERKATMTHDEVVDELRGLRKRLRRTMETAEIAKIAGVTVQTLKQYCQASGTKGARLIPGERLDLLRNEVALRNAIHWSRAQVPFQPREERTWHVFASTMDHLLEVTDELYAESFAMRYGPAVCVPGNRNPGRSSLQPDDRLCVEWLDVRHGGLVDKADGMAVTGTDEWTEGLVGYENRGQRIVPTRAEVDALREIAESRELSNAA